MKKVFNKFKENIKLIVGIIIGIIISGVGVYAVSVASSSVTYDNSTSGATSINVQDALDELYTRAANAPKVVFTQGQLVTYGGEQFYSLYNVTDKDTTMEIFAKTNINPSTCATQANGVKNDTNTTFSSDAYWGEIWDSLSGTARRFNLNNINGYIDSDAIGKSRIYARLKGAISGRLLTYEEAINLTTKYSSMVYGRENTSQGYEYYWLGTINETYRGDVYKVNGESSGTITRGAYMYYSGVRPVLTVYVSQVGSGN